MRILMLSPSYPIPENDGAKRRISAFAHRLGIGHDLTLVALRDPQSDGSGPDDHSVPWTAHVLDNSVRAREAALRSVVSRRSYRELRFWDRRFGKLVQALCDSGSFDLVWVNFLTMSGYIEGLLDAPRRPVLVLDQHNVDDMVWKSLQRGHRNPGWRVYGTLQVAKLRRYQRNWYPRYDLICSVSSEDVALTTKYVAPHKVCLAPNGVDLDYFRPGPTRKEGRRLVFGASMDVAMNQDAAVWFATRVLPLVRRQVPDIEFWIVGRDPPWAIRSLGESAGITVTGTVPDVRDYYRTADVFVVPSRIGGGTKLKTLEGLAMGLPVVATSVGAQGLNIRNGQHIYVADSAEDLAARTVELLHDRAKASAMAAAGRRLVEQEYGWDHIVGDVEARLAHLVAERSV